MAPDSHIPPVDKSGPLTAVRGSFKRSHNSSNGVGEAYVCERDGSSFSGMGNSSLVEVANEAVMTGVSPIRVCLIITGIKIMSLFVELKIDLFAE
jgi:hypothetical protein